MASIGQEKHIEALGGLPVQNNHPPVPVALPPQTECRQIPNEPVPDWKKKGLLEAYILLIPLGIFGAHHFYLRRPGWGVLYLFTLGLLGVGFLVDLFRMPYLVKKTNRPHDLPGEPNNKKSLSDAYLIWFPLGLFGAHHFYLRQWGWAVAYLFTFGLMGMGWLMDLFCMHAMVRDYNEQVTETEASSRHTDIQKQDPARKRLTTAYRLCLFPFFGLLGAHHYYLGRIAYGLFFTFTLGGFGVGWVADWFRLAYIWKDANKRIRDGTGFAERRLDDCYFVAFPAGLFGAHHFYLRRVGWGFLYLFTIGCCGIGWIVDLCRMYRLVRNQNEMIRAKRLQRFIESGNIANIGEKANPGMVRGDEGNAAIPPNVLGQPGVMPPQHVQILGPGTYAVMPAQAVPPYTAVPGVQPPHLPPVYEAQGYSSWSTIESSDVDQPPSYLDSRQGLPCEPGVPVHIYPDPSMPSAPPNPVKRE